MKIEVGKRYVRRDGRISDVIVNNYGNHSNIGFVFKEDGSDLGSDLTYDENGFYYYTESPEDLIKEYKPEEKEMKDTVEVSKQFLLDGHNAACNEWKKRIENEVPQLFKNDFEKPGWYIAKSWITDDFLCYFKNPSSVELKAEYYFGPSRTTLYGPGRFEKITRKADKEEVRYCMENECIRRYGADWKNVKIEVHANKGLCPIDNRCKCDSILEAEQIWNSNGCLFYKGKWATKKEDDPKLVVGKWYWVDRGADHTDHLNALICYQGIGEEHYGFAHNGEYITNYGDGGVSSGDYTITPAANHEVGKSIKVEAKKRGFKKGVKIKYLLGKNTGNPNGDNKTSTSDDLQYWNDPGNLFIGDNLLIFQGETGKWAEIEKMQYVSEPDKLDNASVKSTIASLEKQLEELKKQIG